MSDYERLGVFYLGRIHDCDTGQTTNQPLLYESKDLTTHAVCVGMTGSGKTGLCLALLEEAAIDGIPAIVIDPKGDLGNLLLTFPELRPADFEHWIDPSEAERKGLGPQEYAAQTAERWRQGLADWDQDPARIKRLRDTVDMAIYTPGSSAGLPLNILRSFHAPPVTIRENSEAFRDTVAATAASLLGLVGVDADPLRSREYILVTNILTQCWQAGEDLDMPGLIRAIQKPPFDKLGVVDLESSFPAKDRFEFAMRLNNLLASPGYEAWMQGEPLDIQRLLYTPQGKPRVSILSIAHLADAERMFFVTLLLNETIAWMRNQSGTASLRAILYMDEVFGYFPPTMNPPSKTPMLTLLKQGRAFGLGVVLATQNPVDLDYKGLSNAGTWFLGRLQTERDKQRVLDGLEGATAAAGAQFDRAEMDKILSGLSSRMFLMNDVHEDHPVVFQSRWALSYLRGPLTREQIGRLMGPRKQAVAAQAVTAAAPQVPSGEHAPVELAKAKSSERPVLPPGVIERFASLPVPASPAGKLIYHPALLGQAKLYFAQSSLEIDTWKTFTLLVPLENDVPPDFWTGANVCEGDGPALGEQPQPGARFTELPMQLAQAARYPKLATELKDHLYRHERLQVWKCAALKLTSQPSEDEAAFRVRLAHAAHEERDVQMEKLRQKYAPKVASLQEQIRKAEIRVEKEKSQATQQTFSAALSVGASILGAMLGRKLRSATTVRQAAGSMRSAGRATRERQDVADALENVEVYRQRLADLETVYRAETSKLQLKFQPEALTLEEVLVKPKKADIRILQVALVWIPSVVQA